MRVLDHLVFLAEVKGVGHGDAKKRAGAWLERLGLGDWAAKKVEDLSKGMQQKVQFAGTLLHDPDLVMTWVFALSAVAPKPLYVPEAGAALVGQPVNADSLAKAAQIARDAAKPISDFVNRHPTLKMLALSFLILIGVTLVGEGLGRHIPKGYIYFSMAFAFMVEMLNLRLRAKSKPVELHQPYR